MVCNWCRDNRRFVRDGPEPGRGSPTREGDVERGSDGADEAKAVVSVTNSNASSEKTPQQPNPNSIETAMARASLLDTESETALILLRRPRTTTTSPLATQQHHD